MYAIVQVAGFQYKVQKGDKLLVPKLDAEVGEKLEFQDVLFISEGGRTSVGDPIVPNAKIKAKVLAHTKGDKITVFKMKRRKNYRRKTGHRQDFTQILIEDIKARAERTRKTK
ncbi:MAG TPA: 50S ribosomal protein L21 [Candidatus Latescibacteria bacterium]|nr:50S ribosomal protein L21 [Candidatus Latescibacterota bacterium]